MKDFMSAEMVEALREAYPVGSRVQLHAMVEEQRPVAPGTMGTLESIDDIGTLHVKWDNGRLLGVIPYVDDFAVFPANKA